MAKTPPPGKVDELAEVRLLGGRGPSSGREFDLLAAGGPVRRLDYRRARVNRRGVDVVEGVPAPVRRRGRARAGRGWGMLDRLRGIADGRLEPTDYDLRFYTHELREYVRYRRLGHPTGQPLDPDAARALWNDTHSATLEDYGINEMSEPLYHPSVVR